MHLLWHTIKPGIPEHGATEHGIPAEQRNATGTPEHGTPAERPNNTGTRNNGTPEHGTPAERRNNSGITEHHRNNGTPLERWKNREMEERSTTIEHWRENETLKQRQ